MASQTLSELIVKIGSNVAEALTGLDQVALGAKRMGKDLTAVGRGMSTHVTGPILAVGAGAVASAIKVGGFADTLFDLEDMTNLSTTELQEWRGVALQAGIGADTIAEAVTKMTTRMATGEEGSADLRLALDELGISMTDAAGQTRPMGEIVNEAISRLSGMEDVTHRNVVATRLFGRSAAQLAPVLGLASEEIEGAKQRAHDLGLVIGGDSLTAANEFRAGVDFLKASAGGLVNEFGIAVLPLMQDFRALLQDKVVPAIRGVVQWFGDLSPEVQKTIAVVGGAVAAIGPFLVALGTVVTVGGTVIGALTGIGPILAALTAAVAVGAAAWMKWEKDIRATVQAVIEVVGPAIEGFVNALVGTWQWFARNAIRPVVNFVGNITTWLIDNLGGIFERVGRNLVGFIDFFTPGNLQGAIDGFEHMVNGIRERAVELKEGMLQEGEDATGGLTGMFADLTSGLGSPPHSVDSMSGTIEARIAELGGNVTIEAQELKLGVVNAFSDLGREVPELTKVAASAALEEWEALRDAENSMPTTTESVKDSVLGLFGDLGDLLGGDTGKVGDILKAVDNKWKTIQSILENPLLGGGEAGEGVLSKVLTGLETFVGSETGGGFLGILGGLWSEVQRIVGFIVDKIQEAGTGLGDIQSPLSSGGFQYGTPPSFGGPGAGDNWFEGGVKAVGEAVGEVIGSVFGSENKNFQAVNNQIALTGGYLLFGLRGVLDPTLNKISDIAVTAVHLEGHGRNQVAHLAKIEKHLSDLKGQLGGGGGVAPAAVGASINTVDQGLAAVRTRAIRHSGVLPNLR